MASADVEIVSETRAAPAQPPAKKAKMTEDTKLWDATHAFCSKWNLTDTDALGVRNVMAVFYMLAKAEAAHHAERPAFMDYFPTDERWFDYAGRFLALYTRDTNADGHALRLTATVKGLLDKGLDGVKIVTLKSEEGPAKWVELINADCKAATKGKIPEIVGERDVDDPKFQTCALAAEFIKGKYVDEFKGTTEADATFYGVAGKAAEGTCHMMKHKDLEGAGGGTLVWRGETCTAALLPTTTSDGQPTDFYIVAVLPKPDEATATSKQTKPESLDAAQEEIKNNAAGLRALVRTKELSHAMVELPRFERKMKPATITDMCDALLPKTLMHSLDHITEEATPGAEDDAWQASPMRVNKVAHATYLKLNETGFEAAAATAVICWRSMGAADDGPPPEIIRFDRGFLLYIMDLGDTPHVLYHSRVETDAGLKDAPPAPAE